MMNTTRKPRSIKRAFLAFILVLATLVPTSVFNPDIYVPDALERHCLVQALWFETRGEPQEGIRAVASVILNRADYKNKSVCAIIKERRQFSYRNFTKDAKDERKLIPAPRSQEFDELLFMHNLVTEIQQGKFVRVLPKEVLWYHTTKVKPIWARKMQVHRKIGMHVFLKEKL